MLLISEFEKQAQLADILRKLGDGNRVIIFCTTKRTCDQLAYHIARDFRSGALHGDKKQSERDYIMRSFKTVSGQPLILP